MIGYFKRIIKLKVKKIFLKFYFLKNNSIIGKIVSCKNYKYIRLSRNVRIDDYSRIECIDQWNNNYYNPILEINSGVIIKEFFTAVITDRCSIGENTIFANQCTIVTENHGMNPESAIPYHSQDLINGPVKIGKNCWIATGCIFLPNSEIGDNVIVAAHSVVNKKFPSNVIIAGSPAKIIKKYNFETHEWEKVKNKE